MYLPLETNIYKIRLDCMSTDMTLWNDVM